MHLFIKHVLPFRNNHQGESHVEAKGNENERHEGNRGRRSALREPSFPMREGAFRRRGGETPPAGPRSNLQDACHRREIGRALRVHGARRLKCVGCGHEIMIARRIVEKNTKSIKKVQ